MPMTLTQARYLIRCDAAGQAAAVALNEHVIALEAKVAKLEAQVAKLTNQLGLVSEVIDAAHDHQYVTAGDVADDLVLALSADAAPAL